MRGRVFPFNVIAELPPELSPLFELAKNFWWTWDHQARALFETVATGVNEKLRNPFELISSLSADAITKLLSNEAVRQQLHHVHRRLEEFTQTKHPVLGVPCTLPLTISYFSAEFGIHESLPIYSGGLGVLAGDHLKAASEMGLPLVGVGLLYYEGYFRQYLNNDGWQQETYPLLELAALPLQPLKGSDGTPLSVVIKFDGRLVRVRGWTLAVGRIPLLLLDTNCDENDHRDRMISSRLYGGDSEMRIAQEFVLGVGGLRLLHAAGIDTAVCHMNEGHSAFLVLERIRLLQQRNKLSFEEALRAVRRGSVFTTHTPVPAGNDSFGPELAHRFLAELAQELGVEASEMLKLGRFSPDNGNEPFSMTVLALHGAAYANGVSQLHGEVSRKLWSGLWPALSPSEIPINHITNGAHFSTWVSSELASLLDRYLTPGWRQCGEYDSQIWQGLSGIPSDALWAVRNQRRQALIQTSRERVAIQLRRRGVLKREIEIAQNSLREDVLTIGFARRFATYKRGNLILRDLERLQRIVTNPTQPVQLIFSGKSHPADRPGKEIIAEISHILRKAQLEHRLVFLEDYDMGIARKLVQGVDVWLNNPRRPMEASGTSGMKAAFNGALNVSVLDGWWCEAYDDTNGWSIGQGEEYGEEYHDTHYQDEVESRALYDVLEHEVIPLFYERNEQNIPEEWLGRVRNSLASIIPKFDARRMVRDYAQTYSAAADGFSRDQQTGFSGSKDEAARIRLLRSHWHQIRIDSVDTNRIEHIPRGGSLTVQCNVSLGEVPLEFVIIEACVGTVNASGSFHPLFCTTLSPTDSHQTAHSRRFVGQLVAPQAGRFGFSIRVVPKIGVAGDATIPGLLTWAQ